ncbi:MAG TPA: hypothetical protein QF802_06310 [Candidatus Thalassarchaeaceae archaeon]|jgi:hypothetical protein|nr:hypothetical protein [Candidatus Thalassarchaeaceae archaeon]HJM20050.1 hypothetical protein [Candidatus Thalassarchaeaceae archaeon]
MTIDSKPDGDDMRQFVCSGVNFDIDEKPIQKKRRTKISGVEPRVGLGSLRARAEPKSKAIKSIKRKVRRKDPSNMQSLYMYENEDAKTVNPKHELNCPHCSEGLDVARLLEQLEPHIAQIVSHRVEEREAELRKNLVAEFQRRRIAAENMAGHS